jgi:hypothetical protein
VAESSSVAAHLATAVWLVLAVASPAIGECPCTPFSAPSAVKSGGLIFVGKAVTSVSLSDTGQTEVR